MGVGDLPVWQNIPYEDQKMEQSSDNLFSGLVLLNIKQANKPMQCKVVSQDHSFLSPEREIPNQWPIIQGQSQKLSLSPKWRTPISAPSELWLMTKLLFKKGNPSQYSFITKANSIGKDTFVLSHVNCVLLTKEVITIQFQCLVPESLLLRDMC